MQRFGAIILFYKPLIMWSFGVNIFLTFFNPNIFAALLVKLILTVFVWYLLSETHGRRKLIFYKNLGISPLQLFSSLYAIDALMMIAYLMLVKEFI
ncbi:hypothetical protein SAMN03097699_3374 [Flavobacteriaceae bacterium MAR_2010_188]|nr:hypothetical protein SAMN03097699_3374 [Flavobacteriaceae bacterium MAR_2010_188]